MTSLDMRGIVRGVGLATVLAFAAQALADDGPTAYANRVELAIMPGAAFYRVELPFAVHQGVTRPDFADLRMFNGIGEPVPFGFAVSNEPAPGAMVRITLPLFPLRAQDERTGAGALDLRIRQKPDGTVISVTSGGDRPGASQRPLFGYLLDASANRRAINALVLDWKPVVGGVNVRAGVEVSEDLKHWRTVVSGAPLLDLSFAGQRLRQQDIALDRLQARYLRLSFVGAPVELSGVAASLVADTPAAVRRTVTVAGGAVAGRPLEYQFDLGAALPVDRVAFELPQINTVAPAELLARERDSDPWRAVASTVIYRLAGAGGEVTSPPLAVPVTGARYWLLRLNPASGGLGGGEVRLQAGHLPRHLVFVARGAEPFVIAYGKRARAGEKAMPVAAALPLGSLIPDYRPGVEWSLPAARAGAAVTHNPAAVESGFADRFEPRKLGLWAVLLGAVLVLALMAWRLAGRINKGG